MNGKKLMGDEMDTMQVKPKILRATGVHIWRHHWQFWFSGPFMSFISNIVSTVTTSPNLHLILYSALSAMAIYVDMLTANETWSSFPFNSRSFSNRICNTASAKKRIHVTYALQNLLPSQTPSNDYRQCEARYRTGRKEGREKESADSFVNIKPCLLGIKEDA